MAGLTLVIGNKNYSSWSMRPWVLMRQLGIAFEEKKLHFHSTEWDAGIERWSPSRLVPVLWRGDESVWDSLAIMETLAEWHPEKSVWPRDAVARAFARSIAAEMHSGFRDLRNHMPMNIRASHPGNLPHQCAPNQFEQHAVSIIERQDAASAPSDKRRESREGVLPIL